MTKSVISHSLPGRRQFVQCFASGAATLPLLRWTPAWAADLPQLTPDETAAKALSYTEDATKVDVKSEPLFKADRKCENCALFQIDQAEGDYAPCKIFPGKVVNHNGWCRAWAARPKEK